jgi:hypothetical protein
MTTGEGASRKIELRRRMVGDLVYVLLTIGLFVVLALTIRGAEKL